MSSGASQDSASASPEIHVMFCSNRGYLQHAAVAATSLAALSGQASICIHVVTRDDLADCSERLRETLAPYRNVRVQIHWLEDARIETAFVDRYISGEAYLRLLAPEILPESVERVVYLDCDLVVLGDIAELAAVPLDGKAVGAVPEFAWSGPDIERRLAELGIGPDHTYVNSGVLVMDLVRWRRDGIVHRLFDYVAQEGSRLAYHDQDALNAVLQGDIALLDLRWNLQPLMLGRWSRDTNLDFYRRAQAARRNPGVVHFTSHRKPWTHRVSVRDRRLYFHFLARTAWHGERPPLDTWSDRLEYDLARALLGIRIDAYRLAASLGRLGAAVAHTARAAARHAPPWRSRSGGQA